MATNNKNTQSELQCPYCTRTSNRQQGMSAHVRSAHPTKWNAYRKNGGQSHPQLLNGRASLPDVPPTTKTVTVSAPSTSPANIEQHLDPKWHLLEAQKGIEQRMKDVRLELARMTALQEELEHLQNRSSALQTALQTFDTKTTPAVQSTAQTTSTAPAVTTAAAGTA